MRVIEGSLGGQASDDAPTCMLAEIIKMVFEELDCSEQTVIFPVELYFVKPNKRTCIIVVKDAKNKLLDIDNLFFPSKKKDFFDRRLDVLHECTILKEHDRKWNKARLIINDDESYIFQYRFDRDIDWLYSQSPNDPVVEELTLDVLKKISSWEGLEENHSRHWE